MAYIFQRLANKATKAGIDPKNVADARQWFRDAAMQVSSVNTKQVIATADPSAIFQSLSANSIGKMYCFFYDPKHKKTLPYYDRFPIIFPIEFNNGSMLGINLHYLPPVIRAQLMDALFSTANNDKYNKTTKLGLSYSILKGASLGDLFKPCVKRYLFSHVRSKFMYVSPERWDMAALLPMERFVKASKDKVWAESLEKL
jgi:hypothetical protein